MADRAEGLVEISESWAVEGRLARDPSGGAGRALVAAFAGRRFAAGRRAVVAGWARDGEGAVGAVEGRRARHLAGRSCRALVATLARIGIAAARWTVGAGRAWGYSFVVRTKEACDAFLADRIRAVGFVLAFRGAVSAHD